MNTKLVVVAVVAVLLIAGASVYLLSLGDDDNETGDQTYYPFDAESATLWSYWLGNLDSPGISDAKTPITAEDMVEIWKVSDPVDSSSTNWKVPGSAVCVGDRTYYYRGSDNYLNCVKTSTGEVIVSVYCPSDAVFNMAIAYGDGKIFVPTHAGSTTVMYAFDAETLEQLFVSEPIKGGEVQGAIVYYEGKVYFGTYSGEFACFSSEDKDKTRGNEVVNALWKVDAEGWYNMTPAIFGNYCIIVEKGYDTGGSIAYSIDIRTGAIVDTVSFVYEYCTSGIVAYKGRAYIAMSAITDKDGPIESSVGKTLVIRSFVIRSDGTFDRSSEKFWASTAVNGGTQSIPVIWNDRLYIGGGGSTLGSDEPFNVVNIAADGTMTLAYAITDLKTKGTATITTAYATAENGYAVYIYLLEYGKVLTGEAYDSPLGSADIYVLRDSMGQTEADIVFTMTPSSQQFGYQSFSISQDGYLIVRNDSTLFCYGFKETVEMTYEDVSNAIARILAMAEDGNVNFADIKRTEYRYSVLSEEDQEKVIGYDELRAMYRTVTFVIGDTEAVMTYPVGSVLSVPNVGLPEGKVIVGWTSSGNAWNIISDKVSDDMTIVATIADAAKISFDANGGSATSVMYIVSGSVMGYVKTPEKSGYSFGGWFSGGVEYIPQHSVVSGDMTLTALWLKDSIISFDADGGSPASPITVTYSKEIGTLPTTFKSGFKFLGWYLDDVLYTEDTVYDLEQDITLTAKWSENEVSSVDNGKGIIVTGPLPDNAEISTVRLSQISAYYRAMLTYSGLSTMDAIIITISGDGADGTQDFEVTLPLGTADGTSIDVYYYLGGETFMITGTTTDGVLTVTLRGTTSSAGAQIVLGIATGTQIGDHI